jgi:hypothetical protein
MKVSFGFAMPESNIEDGLRQMSENRLRTGYNSRKAEWSSRVWLGRHVPFSLSSRAIRLANSNN